MPAYLLIWRIAAYTIWRKVTLFLSDKDSEHKFNDGNVTAFTQETVPTRENEISEAVSNISTSENELMQGNIIVI